MTPEKTLLTLLTLGTVIPTILWLAYVVPSIITAFRRDHHGQGN